MVKAVAPQVKLAIGGGGSELRTPCQTPQERLQRKLLHTPSEVEFEFVPLQRKACPTAILIRSEQLHDWTLPRIPLCCATEQPHHHALVLLEQPLEIYAVLLAIIRG